jgi:site-specific DNA-methyltransferase (adenine-specific)
VVAKKLNRKFSGVEQEPEYCQMAVKRLNRAESDRTIQGYHDGYFWERNSLADQKQVKDTKIEIQTIAGLFDEQYS